jgi:monofunctional glycosyltransferase
LIRKGLEAYFTFLIELIWSKERIMEVYLNVIEMGEGIYGIEAAAQTYFKKPAAKLSKREAALIAAVLPNPRRWTPARPTAYISGRQAWILRQMNNLEQVEMGI